MKSDIKLVSKLEFASFLIYSPRGKSPISAKSQRVMEAIKSHAPGRIDLFIEKLAENAQQFPGWFGRDVTVVPVPKSFPFPHQRFVTPENSLWVSKEICLAMIKHGLASEMIPCLRRVTPVKKSAFSKPGERPSIVNHLESMECDLALSKKKNILVVDDVITKGRTMFAAASLIKAMFPSLNIRGFALLRTMGLVQEVDHIMECCAGGILEYKNDDVSREP